MEKGEDTKVHILSHANIKAETTMNVDQLFTYTLNFTSIVLALGLKIFSTMSSCVANLIYCESVCRVV